MLLFIVSAADGDFSRSCFGSEPPALRVAGVRVTTPSLELEYQSVLCLWLRQVHPIVCSRLLTPAAVRRTRKLCILIQAHTSH